MSFDALNVICDLLVLCRLKDVRAVATKFKEAIKFCHNDENFSWSLLNEAESLKNCAEIFRLKRDFRIHSSKKIVSLFCWLNFYFLLYPFFGLFLIGTVIREICVMNRFIDWRFFFVWELDSFLLPLNDSTILWQWILWHTLMSTLCGSGNKILIL